MAGAVRGERAAVSRGAAAAPGGRGGGGGVARTRRDVEVGDALVRVDHRELGARLVALGEVGLDRLALGVGQGLELLVERAEAEVGVDAEGGERSACLAKASLKKTETKWPNMIGSEIFIIVAFRWTDTITPSAFACVSSASMYSRSFAA